MPIGRVLGKMWRVMFHTWHYICCITTKPSSSNLKGKPTCQHMSTIHNIASHPIPSSTIHNIAHILLNVSSAQVNGSLAMHISLWTTLPLLVSQFDSKLCLQLDSSLFPIHNLILSYMQVPYIHNVGSQLIWEWCMCYHYHEVASWRSYIST